MRWFRDWIVTDRLVIAVIVLNAAALVLHEMMMDNTENME